MATGEVTFRPAKEQAVAAPAEAGLVEECRRGDAQAFARLVRLHEGMVLNLAARLLGDVEEARDLAQDVFLQVYRTVSRFEGRSSLKTWIYRIVVNQSRNRRRFWRRHRRDRSYPLDGLAPRDEAQLAGAEAREDGPFERVRSREAVQRVQEALLRIPFDQRAILLLREVEGLSCDQIGASLQVPEGTVKSRLSRAREALRKALGEDRP